MTLEKGYCYCAAAAATALLHSFFSFPPPNSPFGHALSSKQTTRTALMQEGQLKMEWRLTQGRSTYRDSPSACQKPGPSKLHCNGQCPKSDFFGRMGLLRPTDKTPVCLLFVMCSAAQRNKAHKYLLSNKLAYRSTASSFSSLVSGWYWYWYCYCSSDDWRLDAAMARAWR